MYRSDELEESLNEELIKIMMQGQSRTEKFKLVTIAPQLPVENEMLRRTPLPRSSSCPSPTMFMHTEGMNIRSDALSLHRQYGTKYHMRNHLQQPAEHLPPKLDLSENPVRASNRNVSDAGITIEEEEGSKETDKSKMGDKTKKSGLMSSQGVTSFQERLFGLHQSTVHKRKSHTLPLPSKTTGSSSKMSDLLSEPPLSPATITDNPFPPPEPMELQYFECNEVKMRYLVTKMSHANRCSATTCSELCIYIKWYANHRRICNIVYSSKGKCDHCQQFMQWQYQHCVNCKTVCPHKGCADNISWCPQIKQSILRNKLERCMITPVVRKLNHLQQPAEHLPPKLDVSENPVRASNRNVSDASITIEEEEGSKETDKSKIGDKTKKCGSMSSQEVTSFQKRLFGLHQSTATSSSLKLSHPYMPCTVTDTIRRNKEPCPLVDSNITSEKLTSDGGVVSIEEYGLKVIVPRGAIEDRFVVEFQAAASLFGSFAIPNDCRPVSPYVWIAADYVFRKPIQIEFEHHADISGLEDTSGLCMLSACCTKCNSHRPKMHSLAQDYYYINQTDCTLSTNHFCSYCLASKSARIPDRIVAYQYVPENYKSSNEFDEFTSELRFCYDLSICKKTTEKRFAERKMIKRVGLPLRDSLTKMDELHLSNPSRVEGWNVSHVSNKIQVHEIDFRDWYESAEDLADDENRDHYPPRFITHLKCHQQSTLDVTYTLQVIKGGNIVKEYNFSVFVKAKTLQVASPTETCVSPAVSPATLEQKPKMRCLIKFVIPNVKAHWEDVAYVVLEYDDVPVVKAIERNHQNDVKRCCQELFQDWLTTERGIKPKTWSTLLRQLREVEELTDAIGTIKEKLKELQ